MKKPQMKDETRKKVDNFWYYYKFHVLIGAFLLFMVIVFIKDMLGKVDYDYNIAFVTDYMIADEDSQALQGYFGSQCRGFGTETGKSTYRSRTMCSLRMMPRDMIPRCWRQARRK